MAEYIKKEAIASKAVYMHGFGKNKYVPLRAIEEAPAADVAPVVHGRWVWSEENDCWVCSNCELSALNNYRGNSTDSNYCPNCGARMDGE